MPGEGLPPHRAVAGAGSRAVGFPAASGLVGHGDEKKLDWNESFLRTAARVNKRPATSARDHPSGEVAVSPVAAYPEV